MINLPAGKVAPQGGFKVRIDAGINPNTMSYEVLRGGWPFSINSVDIIIPEGENSVYYDIPVVNYYSIDGIEYKPWYALMFGMYNTSKESTQYRGGFYQGPLDLSEGSLKNIDYAFEK